MYNFNQKMMRCGAKEGDKTPGKTGTSNLAPVKITGRPRPRPKPPGIVQKIATDVNMGRIDLMSGGAFGDRDKGRAALGKEGYTDDEITQYYKRTDETIARNKQFPNEQPNDGNGSSASGRSPYTVSAPQRPLTLAEAIQARSSAMTEKESQVNSAFSFATPDYFSNMIADPSAEFNTAFDESTRGIYDYYKGAGLLSQDDLNSRLGMLSDKDTAFAKYSDSVGATSRQNVSDGRKSISDALAAFSSPSTNIGEVQNQTNKIRGYDVAGAVDPYRKAQSSVDDFFSGYTRIANDPTANTSPSTATNLASRASGSVNRIGTNTQPSALSGLRSPYSGSSIRVVG